MGKRFSVIRDVGIEDNLNGKVYTNHRDICVVLNRLNDKADSFAEKLWEIQMEKRNNGE